MQTKTVALKFKESAAGGGEFEGCLSPYGNLDAGGDIVESGAYAADLRENGLFRPALWQHKADEPIGELTLEDRASGLYCRGQLLMSLPTAQTAYALLKAGIVKGLSIGYETVKKEMKDGIRHLKEIRLYEGSIVTFPQNSLATIGSVKSMPDALFHASLRNSQAKIREAHETQILAHIDEMRRALVCRSR